MNFDEKSEHLKYTKYYRDRANRNRRALLKEKETHGYYSDGSGKRYRIALDYMLAEQLEKALDFLQWYEEQFPDDCGEPVFDLYWALAYARSEQIEMARYRLQYAMLSNLYLLPYLFYEPIDQIDMWHSSNCKESDYFLYDREYLMSVTEVERDWLKQEFNSPEFSRLRAQYILTYKALDGEREISRRMELLDDWRIFFDEHSLPRPE